MNRYYLLLWALIFCILSCNSGDGVGLSGQYWYRLQVIESRTFTYLNKIYPRVTDYAFNEKFIIAEQKPDAEKTIPELGHDLLTRYEKYNLYKRNNDIIKDSFYKKYKGVIEKDSLFYKEFVRYGGTANESKNRAVGINIAEDLLKYDSAYFRIFNSKLNYWIIDHVSDSLIGPLTKQEYLTKRTALHIQGELKLQFEK
jgi:hypothetical protein